MKPARARYPLIGALALTSLMFTGAAHAHPGHGAGDLLAGLTHPFVGWDHLLAMLAVGLWSSAALPASRRWAGPLVFMGMLLVGALGARAGLVLPAAEAGIAATLLLLALMLAGAQRIRAEAGLPLIALTALLHGHAHGAEVAAGASFAAYAAGFLAGSALLHGIGLAAGARLLRVRAWAWQAIAALLGVAGAALLVARL